MIVKLKNLIQVNVSAVIAAINRRIQQLRKKYWDTCIDELPVYNYTLTIKIV